MSGVYIPDMEMPDNCSGCPFHIGVDITLRCGLPKDIHIICPLIPVPDHGRCVDADALLKEAWKSFDTVPRWFVREFPAILPPDKEGAE